MSIICLDTSVIIEYTRTQQGALHDLLIKKSQGRQIELITSSVVLFEFWSGRSLANPRIEKIATELFQKFTIHPFDEELAKLSGELRRKFEIDDLDVLIAATALKNADYLATLNVKHFAKVPGLKLWKPSQK